MQGCIQDFCQGGANLEYVKKRGGARLFVAAGQPQGGGGFKGGKNNSRGGRMPPTLPPKYTPAMSSVYAPDVGNSNCRIIMYSHSDFWLGYDEKRILIQRLNSMQQKGYTSDTR